MQNAFNTATDQSDILVWRVPIPKPFILPSGRRILCSCAYFSYTLVTDSQLLPIIPFIGVPYQTQTPNLIDFLQVTTVDLT